MYCVPSMQCGIGASAGEEVSYQDMAAWEGVSGTRVRLSYCSRRTGQHSHELYQLEGSNENNGEILYVTHGQRMEAFVGRWTGLWG